MKRIQNLPSVSYSFTVRLTYPNRIGAFAGVVNALGRHGGDLGACDIVADAVQQAAVGDRVARRARR